MYVIARILLFVAIFAHLASCRPAFDTEEEYQEDFTKWMQLHQKSYTSEHFISRYQTYKANADIIATHNADSSKTYKLGHNDFSDLTAAEFVAKYTGGLKPLPEPIVSHRGAEAEGEEVSKKRSGSCGGSNTLCSSSTVNLCCPIGTSSGQFASCAVCLNSYSAQHPPAVSNPTTIVTPPCSTAAGASCNWTATNSGKFVTPIKNQGSCGSCWSFSATGAIESAYAITLGSSVVSLSEEQLIDCTSGLNNGCNGGLSSSAFWEILNYNGEAGHVDTEASYPFSYASSSTNTFQCKYSSVAANIGATIKGYTYVTANSESALLSAVAVRPVSVGLDATSNFQLYKSGIFSDTTCSATALNHAVLAVGYGGTGSSAYWLLKNQWGTYWGQRGYMQLYRGSNMCGVAATASYPII